MPQFEVVKAEEAPQMLVGASRAARELQRQYDEYLNSISGGLVGKLVLNPGESLRGVKIRVRRAATRLHKDVDVWDANGVIYFRLKSEETKRRRRRAK